jgi:hypothetical protein
MNDTPRFGASQPVLADDIPFTDDDIPFADGIDPDIAIKIEEIAEATGGRVDRHGVARDCRCPIPFCDAPRMRARPGSTQVLLWCEACGERREGRKHSKHLAQALFRKHGIRLGQPKGLPPIPKAALALPEPARSAYLWLDKLFRFIGPRANDSLPMLWDWMESGRCDDLGSRLCEELRLGCPIPAHLLKLGFAVPRRGIRAILKTLTASGLVRLFKIRGRNIRGKPFLNKFGLTAMPGADGSPPTYVEPDEELLEGFESVEGAGNTENLGCYYTSPAGRVSREPPSTEPTSVDTAASYSHNSTTQNVEIPLEGLRASSEGSPFPRTGSTGSPQAARGGLRGLSGAFKFGFFWQRMKRLGRWFACEAFDEQPGCSLGCGSGCVRGLGERCSFAHIVVEQRLAREMQAWRAAQSVVAG